MRGWRRFFLTFVGVTGAVAIALFFGATERGLANTEGPSCAGKLLCVALTDQVQASRSPTGVDHYLTDSFTVANTGGSSNLVNVVVTVTWKDDGAATTTSEYRAAFSDSRCSLSGTTTLTCTTPKSIGPGETLVYEPLVFRTALDSGGASDTEVTVHASAKEQANSNKQGKNAFVEVANATTYEGSADLDVSIAGGDIPTVTLGTAQTGANGQQSSKLPVPATANRDFYTLSEEAYPVGFCPTGITCFGQHVTTVATGLSPVNLQITYTGPLPSGTTENSISVFHLRDGDTTPVTISDACSGDLFSGQPPSSQIPCRRVDIVHLSGGATITYIDAWDISNGGWGVG